ncbi:hypothetical protein [Kribbella sindirgiensis]|uniref:Uncharacterized protein n=1 Tax=Kribbella sindirgiensis TaxID=1124744 RepID=A0A4R0HZ70_9ACTN|nr:hypothetical protein [Kribbella sindirgiensis]TCC16333.1 hypothetical protein E0H50_40840 [Kribbella sindirgiensis]
MKGRRRNPAVRILLACLMLAAFSIVAEQEAQADVKYICYIGFAGTCDTGRVFPYSNGCVTVGAGSRPSEMLIELKSAANGYTVWSTRIYASASAWHQSVCGRQTFSRSYVRGTLIYSGLSVASIQGSRS